MSQIVKIQQKSPEFPKKKRFDELPRKELPVKPLRISRAKEQENKRPRNGNFQMGVIPDKKAKIIEDGRKLK